MRGDSPALVTHIGPGAGRDLAALPLRPGDRRVDLERVGAHGGALLKAPADTRPGAGGHGDDRPVGLVAVVAATLADLRRAVAMAGRLPRTHHLVAVLTAASGHHDPPLPSPPGHGQWRELQEARVRRLDDGGWVCELFFLEPVETGPALDAVASGAIGRRRGPAVTPAVALSGPDAAPWVPGTVPPATPKPEGPVERRRTTPLADVALRVGTQKQPPWEDTEVPTLERTSGDALSWAGISGPQGPARIRRGGLVEDAATHLPPVDERVVNPVGFVSAAGRRLGTLAARGGRPVVVSGRQTVAELPESGAVSEVDLARLRSLRGIQVEWSGYSGPLPVLRAVIGLAAGGVPVFAEAVPGWAEPLGEELGALLTSVCAEHLGDRLDRERYSVALRRCALRTHATAARWRELGAQAQLGPLPEPRVSVLLCTRRPELVGFALDQVARQRGVDLEVVLALHGFGADAPGVARAIDRFAAGGREITVYEAERGEVFGAVLNRTAARAAGTVIAKWDDDFYGPHHLADLMLARTYAAADVVGCGPEFVYLEEIDRTVWRPGESERAVGLVSGGSLLTDRVVLEECGWFRRLPRAVDTQLMLAVGAAGGRVYRTHAHNYLVRRRSAGHTWTEDDAYFLRDAQRQWPGRRLAGLAGREPAGAPGAGASQKEGETD
ncbi:glycosyl transferase family 2 [Streptomonospora litoralis]|uniref:glycosyl transferase family 2 n=1 Tax=Streptomonospora litoralis TaxID=2498135 RepID=UPI001F613A54|nr:glycosyl transferase family 2 [Streptomonospora litoralis]